MKAIEINTKKNNKGQLKIDIPLKKRNKNVRVLILFSDEEDLIDDDKIWLYSNSQNPSFNFLSEPEENIYSLNDGEPLKND